MFAFEHEGIRPDAVTIGKALSGGFYPVSAFLARSEVMNVFTPGIHGSTYGGNPLACAVACAALDVLVEERLSERAADLGGHLARRLAGLRSPLDPRVRSIGLWAGIDAARVRRRRAEALPGPQGPGAALQGHARAHDSPGTSARHHARRAGLGRGPAGGGARGRFGENGMTEDVSAIAAAQALPLATLVTTTEGVSPAGCWPVPVGNVPLFAFDPGQGLEEHTSPFDALVLVLEGALALTIGGQGVRATPGTIVRMPGGVPHALEGPSQPGCSS